MLIKIMLTFFYKKNAVKDWALAQCISIMVIKIILTFFFTKKCISIMDVKRRVTTTIVTRVLLSDTLAKHV